MYVGNYVFTVSSCVWVHIWKKEEKDISDVQVEKTVITHQLRKKYDALGKGKP
jgi:hypothetical protein